MNERRSELVRAVSEAMLPYEIPGEKVDAIIALVTEARDAEIREALLSEQAAVAFTGSAEGVMVDEYRRDMSDALDAAFGPARSDLAG